MGFLVTEGFRGGLEGLLGCGGEVSYGDSLIFTVISIIIFVNELWISNQAHGFDERGLN